MVAAAWSRLSLRAGAPQAFSSSARSSTSRSAILRNLSSSTRTLNASNPLNQPVGHAVSPKKRSIIAKTLRFTGYTIGSIVFGLAATTAIILAHDALTYREAHIDKVPLSPLALEPKKGGPKNLPILSSYAEDEQDDVSKKLAAKERLVIVGGGWAAVGLLKTLDPEKYNITLISPNNYYLFNPLLPSAAVGTVEPRSLIEPLRKLLARVHGHYIQGFATDVVMGGDKPTYQGGEQRLLEVNVISGDDWDGEALCVGGKTVGERKETVGKSIYVPYDRLIVAVGSVTNTHGVPGLENCFHLKTISDSRKIRSHILDNLEVASLPTTTAEERKRLLSFVVCGGGPTGVEVAAEISDMINEDVFDYFPKVLKAEAQVHLIQSREHILNTYSEKISEYAEAKFARDAVDVIVNARVKRVEADRVLYTVKDAKSGQVVEKEVPSGFTLWSTGIAMSPFTRRVTEILPNQSHLKALQIDSHLRVKGAPLGTMYALGDASTIDTRLIDYLYDFVDRYDKDKDGKLSYQEFETFAKAIRHKFPIASKHFTKLREMFDEYDVDHDGQLNLNEIANVLIETGNKMTALPATAQVAAQQGHYLGNKLNKLAARRDDGGDMHPHTEDQVWDVDDEVYKPFKYTNLGSLAYIGNAAAFDLPIPGGSFAGGLIAMYAWRSFYLSESVSMRTRALLLGDYVKRGIWGRDLSRI
ncbi:probable NADH dehydrogenase (ubiquinone), 64 kD subunit, mitochondrial [Melanopsichium pennsylvanicum]|uniref:Probable NADH dehydrogenase (Ubiquinone), 64 kD subunit, mitochondrial n=2 Tax=Melanopsichium pennsylvanicum TaxID=63383 RepID=A0AAJ5C696_9BASI|nr:probable NADH dehydrogenase (ubiquinone), 64 kD subunit, mitochondrial [Melanopsichium pennsylvanicum 4]SNX85333.1 probable NADH dehydrogenase (ubiquinone), 64 kD subunit, mitochondrial [Melanopsichium pennsylvanicum]